MAGLASFVADPRPTATQGVVSGRRRRGKSHLLQALAAARDLLAVKGFDTRNTVLACYPGAGFRPELATAKPDDVRLVGLEQL